VHARKLLTCRRGRLDHQSPTLAEIASDHIEHVRAFHPLRVTWRRDVFFEAG
jgi:hypothetical protein